MYMNKTMRTISLIFFVFLIVSCKDKTPSPTANFNFTLIKGEVTFTNQSINADTYQWDFGDGIGKSNEKDPKYKYQNVGQYKVLLKSTGLGGDAQIEKIIDIKIVEPTASFSFTILTNGVVQFKNESKDANSFVWDFGDNVGKSSEKDPLYKYLKPGQYKVTLKSVGAGGEIQTQNQVEVKSLKPTALFSFTMLTNGDVQFKNESKDANSFVWGIEGQSNVLTLKDPKVSFVYNGKYKVKLRAEGFGDFDEIEQTLTITNGKEPAPISDFSFQDLGLGKFRFTNKSINASSYIWDFGDDNGKSTLENPDYTFQENGLFNVKLTSNGKGGTNSKVILTKVTSSFDYFSYTIENKSVFSIIAFNNDSNKPLQNFAEVLIPSNSKVIVKVRSNTGLVPMLKSADPNLQLEYVTIDNKIYTLNAYYFYYEVKFTGNCKPITVITNIKGQKETFNDVGLPSSLNAKLSNLDILEVQAFKNNVNGILNIQIYLKNILIQTKTITDPFESILIKYNSSKKQFEVSNNSPEEWYCGVYNSNKLITGPKGGCYYINSNGNKTYVDRGLCNCN